MLYMIASSLEISLDGLTVMLEGQTASTVSMASVSHSNDTGRGAVEGERQGLQLAVQRLHIRQAKEQELGILSCEIGVKVSGHALDVQAKTFYCCVRIVYISVMTHPTRDRAGRGRVGSQVHG